MIREYNYNLALLKILCCFDVILRHFYPKDKYYIDLMTLLAVPLFIIISFFFTTKLIISGSKKELMSRVVRLIVPMWIWGDSTFLLRMM